MRKKLLHGDSGITKTIILFSASKEFGDVRPQAASMPMSSLPPPSQLPSQLTSPAHPLPPPVTGFVASGTPSKVGLS